MRTISGMAVAITGATSGIGLALAEQLHAAGARVAVCGRRADRLEALRQRLPGLVTMTADVAHEDECQRFVAEAHAAFGRLDTLVCNAGVGLLKPTAETTRADWEAILAANLHGTADCLRAATPVMRAQAPVEGWRGQVVIVSSVLARRSAPDVAAYSASKAAQLSLAESARVELAAERIAVTSVHPCGTRSEFFTATEARSGHRFASGHRDLPQQSPDDVARAIIAAIARPRPEVWPAWWGRWLAIAAVLWPSLADRTMAKNRRIAD